MGGYVLYLVSSDYQLGGQAFHLKAWRLANLSKSDSIFCWIDPWRLYYKLNLEHNRRGIKKANVFGLGLANANANASASRNFIHVLILLNRTSI